MDAAQATPAKYDMDVVRWFSIAAVIYLVVGTLIGVWIAAELAWPSLNFIPAIAFGDNSRQGICRTGMADRYPDRRRLAGVRAELHHDHRDPQDVAYLCVQLVLHGHDRDDHLPACGEQPGHSGQPDPVLFHLLRRAGCHDPVVVGT